jgi:protein TonB
MTNRYTPQQDVLDILFANRNRDYGAYRLRRTYPNRLKKSIGFMLGGVALLSAGIVWEEHRSGHLARLIHDPVVVHVFHLIEPPVNKPIEHPAVAPVHRAPRPAAAAPPLVATAPLTDPKLVDKPDPSKDMPEIHLLDNRQIGAPNVMGPATGVVAGGQPATATAGGKTDDGPVDMRVVERMPEFPGGEEALKRFFMRYLETPEELEAGSQVKVVVRFVVGKDGELSAYAVQQSGGKTFDTEVVRVLKKMPKWTPGVQNGHPVSVYFNLPVTFMRSGD